MRTIADVIKKYNANMYLGTDKNGCPALFINDRKVLTLITAKKIVYCNEFLRSMDTGIEIKFETYSQYGQLLMDVMEALAKKKANA